MIISERHAWLWRFKCAISFHPPFLDLEPHFWEWGMCGGEDGHPVSASPPFLFLLLFLISRL